MIQDKKSARIYAAALLEMMETPQELDLINDFLQAFEKVNSAFSSDFIKKIKPSQFNEEIIGTISKEVSIVIRDKLINFLKILFLNKKLHLFPQIQKIFLKEAFKNKNIMFLSLTTARNWTQEEKKKSQSSLEKIFPRLIIAWDVDSTLLAGLRICFGDWVIDLSGRRALMLLKKQLANS